MLEYLSKRKNAPEEEHPGLSSEIASIIRTLDLILSGNETYDKEIDSLAETYNAKNSDCSYLAHRYADRLYRHVMDSSEDQKAVRCIMKVEVVALATLMDAFFSQLNRHGAREKYLCDDTTLNSNPDMLIEHHNDSGGASSAWKMFRSIYN